MENTPRLRYRSSFAWNLVGNTLYSASQWLLIVILARMMSPDLVGNFALMLAISAPIFLTVGMNLRALQVTDFERRYSLGLFYSVRNLQNVVATAVTLVCGLLFNFHGWEMAALAVLCIAKSVETYSQSTYGYFQVMRRLDLVSKSLIIRSVVGPSCFALGVLSTSELAGGILGLAAAWTIVQLLFDRKESRRLLIQENREFSSDRSWSDIKNLFRDGSFLGVDQGVSSLAVNVPRYAIETLLSTAKVGVYASQAYIAQVITMISSAMLGVLMPELVEAFHRANVRRFLKLLGFLCMFAFGVFAFGVIGALLFGDTFIRLTLGEEYVDQALLAWLMASAGATTLQRVLSKALEASRKFAFYLWIDLATVAVILVSVVPFIGRYGLAGAAMAMVVGYITGAVLFAVMLWRIVSEMRSRQ